MKIEERRRAIARRVLELAAVARSRDELLDLIAKEYKHTPDLLGSGCFRKVFSLPANLVLKVQYRQWGDDNRTEWEAYQKHPDLLVPMYGYLGTAHINVLVVRRARIEPADVVDSTTGDWKLPRAHELSKKVHDASSCNMGFVGKQLYITDAGNGMMV